MALVKCAECGTMISTEARVCPQCGGKNKRRKKSWMKRIFVALLVLISLFVIYDVYEVELNPNIPTCESSHGRKVFVGLFEKSPWAMKNMIRVIDVIEQKEISSGSRPDDRVCEVTFRLTNVTNKTYIFTFEDKENGGYIVRARPK